MDKVFGFIDLVNLMHVSNAAWLAVLSNQCNILNLFEDKSSPNPLLVATYSQ